VLELRILLNSAVDPILIGEDILSYYLNRVLDGGKNEGWFNLSRDLASAAHQLSAVMHSALCHRLKKCRNEIQKVTFFANSHP
jgi:hypothetical protein